MRGSTTGVVGFHHSSYVCLSLAAELEEEEQEAEAEDLLEHYPDSYQVRCNAFV